MECWRDVTRRRSSSCRLQQQVVTPTSRAEELSLGEMLPAIDTDILDVCRDFTDNRTASHSFLQLTGNRIINSKPRPKELAGALALGKAQTLPYSFSFPFPLSHPRSVAPRLFQFMPCPEMALIYLTEGMKSALCCH